MIGVGATYGTPDPQSGMDVQVTEIAGPTATDICRISIATNGELIHGHSNIYQHQSWSLMHRSLYMFIGKV